MAYIVRAYLSKADDKPWFWTDLQHRSVIEQVKDGIKDNPVILSLFDVEPKNLHEAVWEIPATDENHAQMVMMELISWQDKFDFPAVKDLAQLVMNYHSEWKENLVIDPV